MSKSNIEEAREELLRYKFLLGRIETKRKDYYKFLDRAMSVSGSTSQVNSRSNMPSDKVGDNVIKAVDSETEELARQKKMWKDAEKERIIIEERVDKLSEPFRTIIEKRYLTIDKYNKRMQFKQIAYEMGERYNDVVANHNLALIEYYRINLCKK